MKKIPIIFSILLSSSFLFSPAVSAENIEFKETFFPSGKISLPSSSPCAEYSDRDDDGMITDGEIKITYHLPDELVKINDKFSTMDENDFIDTYNTFLNQCGIQIDVKFDNGHWLSESGDWNILEYGDNIDTEDYTFLLYDSYSFDEASEEKDFWQCSLSSYDKEDPANDFYVPYVTETTDSDGFQHYVLDLSRHTLTYRIRYFVTYFPDIFEGEYDTFEEGNIIISDWTSEFSVKERELSEPDSFDAPKISDFSLIENEEKKFLAEYYLEIPVSVKDGISYFSGKKNISVPYNIETQIRTDNGEWESLGISEFSDDGFIYAAYSKEIPYAAVADIRARFVRYDGEYSEWSDIISAQTETADEYLEANPEKTDEIRKIINSLPAGITEDKDTGVVVSECTPSAETSAVSDKPDTSDKVSQKNVMIPVLSVLAIIITASAALIIKKQKK